jgi:aminomethyltransferase
MKTPLFDTHIKLGARMAPFAGWDMPIQYEGILAEHAHTRTAASIFDTCHMGEVEIKGPNAEADLEKLVTQSVATLADGQCRYGFLLKEDGGVIDDLMVYRWNPEHFFIVVNAGTREGDVEWIRSRVSPDTEVTDLSPGRAKLDVQGPHAKAELEKVLGVNLPELKYFRFANFDLDGVPAIISRTGYTGEWGYEFYFPAEETVRIWEKLTTDSNIRPAGLGARDTLRLEVGYALYGSELSGEQSPVSASRGMFISTDKDFVGKEVVARDLENGVPRYLAALQLETKRAARAHDKVHLNGSEVGEVTSGAMAPSLGYAVALAYVDAALTEAGTALEVVVRGKALPARVVDLPFYKDGTARKKAPPAS